MHITNDRSRNTLLMQAKGLAMAQNTVINEGVEWVDAFRELEEMAESDKATLFEPSAHLQNLTWDQLYDYVDSQADTIFCALEIAYQKGCGDTLSGAASEATAMATS